MHGISAESIEKLRGVSVSQLADCLGPSCPIETEIHPFDIESRICGPARTARCEPGENLTLHHALHLAHPGEVLVASGSLNCGLWGELMSTSAKSRGLEGTVIDGAARDPVEVKASGYAVFARCIHPRKALKDKYGNVDVPVRCGSLVVNPGDIIVADANGIITFPAARLEEALRLGLDLVQKEKMLMKQFRSGQSMFEIAGMGRYVPKEKAFPS
ncbi:MAG: RraA family protein [Terriglobia bacterium]